MSTLHEEVPQFLHRHGIRLNTDLGQHFLIDEAALEDIVASAAIEKNERVVEIGPGIGILTRELLKNGAHVTAIELDQRLIPLLESFINQSSSSSSSSGSSSSSNLTIIQGNALHVSMPSEPYKVVANIPYHITSPLLRHFFLESSVTPTSLTLLIQKEVAQTICDEENAGMLTILVGIFGKASYVATVPPSSFLPPPAVDSAILHVDCYPSPKANPDTIDRIFTLTKIGFGQKRKMLRNTLGSLPNGMEHLSAIDIDPTRRPQTITIEEWIRLAEEFRP